MSQYGVLTTCKHCRAQVTTTSVRNRDGHCPICLGHLGITNTKRKVDGNKTNARRLRRIGDRDDWTCHLCGLYVEQEDASIDHLIPRSQGGTRALHNVALSHWKCNNIRGDRAVRDGRAHVRRVLGLA